MAKNPKVHQPISAKYYQSNDVLTRFFCIYAFWFFKWKPWATEVHHLAHLLLEGEKNLLLASSHPHIQVSMSFNILKHPEVFLEFKISMLTRLPYKFKLMVLLNTSLKFSEVLGFHYIWQCSKRYWAYMTGLHFILTDL